MKHANNFDFLRFLFSFLVVVGHTIILSQQKEFQNKFFAAMPNYSVFCFFIISGFLIFSSIERHSNLKTYIKNRIKRIFPAYIVVVIFFSVFLCIFSYQSATEYFSVEWLKYLVANLLFLNFLEPCINFVFSNNFTCAVNGSLWTIKVELMFYAFVPILYYSIRNRSLFHKNIILIILYGLSIAYFTIISIALENDVLAKQFPGSLMYFVSGIFLYINHEYFKRNIGRILPLAILLILIEKILLSINILTPFLIGIIIFWAAFVKSPLRHFGKYGDFSYGMYLVHFPIVQIFVQEGLFEKYSFYGFAICILVVITISIIIWHLIEKPSLNFRRKSAL